MRCLQLEDAQFACAGGGAIELCGVYKSIHHRVEKKSIICIYVEGGGWKSYA